MALNTAEIRLLEGIGKDAREAKDASIATATTVNGHTHQHYQHREDIIKIYEALGIHADKLTSTEAKQSGCPARAQFSSRFQRGANNLGFWAIIGSCTVSPIIAAAATYYFTK